MKVALVNPPYGYNENQKIEPIGLGYLMAMLDREGIKVDGYDLGQSTKSAAEIADFGQLQDYDVVGFSTYNDNVRYAVEIAEEVKKRNPNVKIIFGGPHATATHSSIFKRHPVLDIVVRKEGEYSLLEIVRHLESGEPFHDIKGISFRLEDGSAWHNEDREQIGDLDALPFPVYRFKSDDEYEILSFRGKPALMISSSRSCPFDCSFCGVIFIGRKWRMRSAESVLEELKYMEEQNGISYSHIYFTDANFFVRPDRALEIAETLHAYNPQLTFSFSSRANQIVKAREYIPKLKALGCEYVEIGIESNSEDVLKRMSKRTKPSDNVQAIEILRESDIELILDFIMFDPEATLVDLRKNLDFMRQMGFYEYAPHQGIYQYLVLYAGAPIRDHYEQMFNKQWDPDGLPDHRSLFVNEDVVRVFDLVHAFKKQYQATISGMEKEIGGLLHRVNRQRVPEEHADTVIRLRFARLKIIHAPYLFFEKVLMMAERNTLTREVQVADVLALLHLDMENMFATSSELYQQVKSLQETMQWPEVEESTKHPFTGDKQRAIPELKEAR